MRVLEGNAQMERGSMRSANVLASVTASIVGTEYVSVPATIVPKHERSTKSKKLKRLGCAAPVSSKTITASETVVLVTPARVAAAPIMAHCTFT